MDPSRVFTQRQARMEAADSADWLSLSLQSRHPIFRPSTNSSRPLPPRTNQTRLGPDDPECACATAAGHRR